MALQRLGAYLRATFAPLAAGMPTGGTAGQVLMKTGSGNYAATWQDEAGGGGGGGAEEVVDSATITSSTTHHDFVLPNPTTHDYAVVFDGVYPTFLGGILQLLFSTDGGATFLATAVCQNLSYGLNTSGTPVIRHNSASAELYVSPTGQDTAATSAAAGRLNIRGPGSTTSHKSIDGAITYRDQSNNYTHFTVGARVLTTSVIDALRIQFFPNNIAGARLTLLEIARS